MRALIAVATFLFATCVAAQGLLKTDHAVGKGAEATAGKTVVVNYTGWLLDPAAKDRKGKQFDSSMGRGPFILQNADSRSLGAAFLVVGCVLLVVEVGGVLLSGMRFLLPFALVALGLWITWRARRRARAEGESAGEPA